MTKAQYEPPWTYQWEPLVADYGPRGLCLGSIKQQLDGMYKYAQHIFLNMPADGERLGLGECMASAAEGRGDQAPFSMNDNRRQAPRGGSQFDDRCHLPSDLEIG